MATTTLSGRRSQLEAQIASLRAEGEAITRQSTLTPAQEARALQIPGELSQARSDLAEVQQIIADEERLTAAANVRNRVGTAPAARVTSEAGVYRKDDVETSFFRDLHNSTRGDWEAAERLHRNNAAAGLESRALSSSAAAGGTFAPPAWLVDEYVAHARAHRVTADLLNRQPLPDGISSVNLPKVASGTGVGVTQTQNTAITQTDITTTSVSSGITEITGGQTVSLALLRQSGVPLDQVILGDLVAEYSRVLNQQVLIGTGANGQLRGFVTSGTTVTYTTTQPAVVSTSSTNSFYNRVISAANQVATTRYLPADALVMHPRRWAWILQALDGDSRPLVVPTSATNAPGISTEIAAEGSVGQFGGLPVFIDPTIPTNLGASTNQDVAYVLRREDFYLWESSIEALAFDATLAPQNSVFYRVLGFAAAIFDRYQGSLQKIDGTGMVAPTL